MLSLVAVEGVAMVEACNISGATTEGNGLVMVGLTVSMHTVHHQCFEGQQPFGKSWSPSTQA